MMMVMMTKTKGHLRPAYIALKLHLVTYTRGVRRGKMGTSPGWLATTLTVVDTASYLRLV